MYTSRKAKDAGMVRKTSLLRNTIWMLLGNSGRLFIQALYFVLVARYMGAEQYGAFVGAISFIGIFAPFAGLGGGNILVKNISRDPSQFAKWWGHALTVWLLSTTVVFMAALLIGQQLLKQIPIFVLLGVALSDLIFSRLMDTAGHAFQGFQLLRRTAQFQFTHSVSRLAAAFLCVWVYGSITLELWSLAYLASTLLSTLIALFYVRKELGKPHYGLVKSEVREGVHFAITLSSSSIYNDVDKTLLARLDSLEATGAYAAAYRILDALFSPVRSLLSAAYARFFQKGTAGIASTSQYAIKLGGAAWAYASVTSVILYFAAPYATTVLGQEYETTIEVLQWLSLLPMIRVVHYFAADTLTGAGFQSIRSKIQISVALLNVCLNLWLIPLLSWKGAAIATIASDGFLGLTLVLIVLVLWRRKSEADTEITA